MENTSAQKTVGFYRVAGVSALIFVALIVLDIVTSIMAGKAPMPGTLSAQDIYGLFQTHPYRAFQYLGFLNVIEQLLMLIVVYGFYLSHRDAYKNLSNLTLVVFCTGLAVYLANNVSLPLFHLSLKYAASGPELKPMLEAAGEALLAKGEDFTPGSLPGFVLGEISLFMMFGVMYNAKIFSKVSTVIGFIGALLLTIFTLGATLNPPMYNTLITASMIGGLMILAWYVMTAVRFFTIGGRARAMTWDKGPSNR